MNSTNIARRSVLIGIVSMTLLTTTPTAASPHLEGDSAHRGLAEEAHKTAVTGQVVVGDVAVDSPLAQVPRALSSGVSAVSMGTFHALALKGGRVYAWGTGVARATVPAAARSGVRAISAGTYHNLAIKNGGVIAWGDWPPAQEVPAAMRSGVSAVAAGFQHSLALKNGRVYAWGSNYYGETEVPRAARSNVKAIGAGDNFSVALRKDGRVVVWGRVGEADPWNMKVPAEARSGVDAIAVGRFHVLALKKGTVIAFGSRQDLDYMEAATTVPDAALSKISAVAVGGSSYALRRGKLLRWGLGDDDPLPTQRVLRIEAGSGGYLAIVAT